MDKYDELRNLLINSPDDIERWEKIENQKNKDYEVIIIDGHSVDSTIEIIKKYENLVNFC